MDVPDGSTAAPRLVAREVRGQELVVERSPDGGTVERPASAEEADATVLGPEEISTLARLGTETDRLGRGRGRPGIEAAVNGPPTEAQSSALARLRIWP